MKLFHFHNVVTSLETAGRHQIDKQAFNQGQFHGTPPQKRSLQRDMFMRLPPRLLRD